jgi:hypothetical protein
VSESVNARDSRDEGTSTDSTLSAGDAIVPLDFNILVLSLNTSALIQLGEGEGAEGKIEMDLAMARHTIDMLGILEEKTRGNLTGEEEKLLHQVLFDLRMRYTRKAPAQTPATR